MEDSKRVEILDYNVVRYYDLDKLILELITNGYQIETFTEFDANVADTKYCIYMKKSVNGFKRYAYITRYKKDLSDVKDILLALMNMINTQIMYGVYGETEI